jgi:hypothetical protein
MSRYVNPHWVQRQGCWYYGDDSSYLGKQFHAFENANGKVTVRVPNETGTGGEILELACAIEAAKVWVEIEASNHANS